MNEIFRIQSSLDNKAKLLNQALLLEKQAFDLRKQVGNNDLKAEIKSVHVEIFKLLDRIDLLYGLINLACHLFGSEEQIPISLDTYQNLTFQGKSIEMIESELKDLTSKVVYLVGLLDQICKYVGHDYMFIKDDMFFDFDCLETTLEKRSLHYCAICGDAIVLDLEDKKDFNVDFLDYLNKLRKARKMQVYVSKFIIQENLSR